MISDFVPEIAGLRRQAPIIAAALFCLFCGACFGDDGTDESDQNLSIPKATTPPPQPSEPVAHRPSQASQQDREVTVEAAERRSRRSNQKSNRESLDKLTEFILPRIDNEECPPFMRAAESSDREFFELRLLEGAKVVVANHWGRASAATDDDEILDLEQLGPKTAAEDQANEAQANEAQANEAQANEDQANEDQANQISLPLASPDCPSAAQFNLLISSVIFDEIRGRREILKAPKTEQRSAFLEALHELLGQYFAHVDAHGGADNLASITAAFDAIAARYGWRDTFDIPRHPPVSFYAVDFSAHTRQFLMGDEPLDEPLALPERWRGLPFSDEGQQALKDKLAEFSAAAVSGKTVARPDTFTNAAKDDETTRARHLDLVTMRNVFASTFPHNIESTQTLRVDLVTNPGAFSPREIAAQQLRVAADQWQPLAQGQLGRQLLARGLTESEALIDPLAWTYTSARLGRYAAYLMERAAQIAARRGQSDIDGPAVFAAIDREISLVLGPGNPPRGDGLGARSQRYFEDRSAAAGFPQDLATYDGTRSNARFSMQRFVSSGVAVGDLTANGYPDLYIAGEGLGRLFVNGGGEAPGTFDDRTEQWHLPEDTEDIAAALFVDLIGDDALELVLIRSDQKSQIFVQEDGQFVDRAADLGFRTKKGAHSASIADFDGDGRLDIYVGYYNSERYLRGSSQMNLASADGRNGRPNQLWRQNERGRFEEVARPAGVDDRGWTLATAAFDYDRDGDLDLYVVNDFGPNRLFKNTSSDGAITFEDVSLATATGDAGPGMNASVADVTGNGYFDIFVANIDMYAMPRWPVFPERERRLGQRQRVTAAYLDEPGNRLFANGGDDDAPRRFESQESLFGDHDQGWSWGAVFFDYDLDGDQDFYLTNGWVAGTTAANQKNRFYLRRQNRFDLQPRDGVEAFSANSRTVVAVDVDRDGRQDLVVNSYRQPPRLLRNTYGGPNQSLQIGLHGPSTNRMAIGAIVEVDDGDRRQLRQVSAGSDYLGQQDPLLTFGIGDADSLEVTVHWPDGTTDTIQTDADASPLSIDYDDDDDN